jgi:hypothetical protein
MTKSSTIKNKGYTPFYMAPEQNIGKCYECLTDVYGFGSTVVDIFFGIKIEYGKRLQEFLDLKLENEIEIGIKKILEKCLKEEPK